LALARRRHHGACATAIGGVWGRRPASWPPSNGLVAAAFPRRAEQNSGVATVGHTTRSGVGLAPGSTLRRPACDQHPRDRPSRASSAARWTFGRGPAGPVGRRPCWPAVTAWRCCHLAVQSRSVSSCGPGAQALVLVISPLGGAMQDQVSQLRRAEGSAACPARRPRHGPRATPAPPASEAQWACGLLYLAPERLRAGPPAGFLEEVCWSRGSLVLWPVDEALLASQSPRGHDSGPSTAGWGSCAPLPLGAAGALSGHGGPRRVRATSFALLGSFFFFGGPRAGGGPLIQVALGPVRHNLC